MLFLIGAARRFAQNLALTVRVALPARFDVTRVHATAGQMLLALLAGNAASVAFSAASNWPVGELDPWGITSLLAGSFVSVAALALSAIVVMRGERAGALIVVGSLVSVLSFPLWWLMKDRAEDVSGPFTALAFWLVWLLPQILVILRGLSGPGRIGWLRGVPAAAIYVGMLAAVVSYVPMTQLYYPAGVASDDGENEEFRTVDVEELYYAQPELTRAAVEGLRNGEIGRRDLFAVLGAGSALQGVFLSEVEQVAEIARRDLGAEGRVLTLANSMAEPDRLPLLSKRNLRSALHEVGARMQKDEDIAFLFLTSHGSPEQFSLGYYQAGLGQLSSGELSDMLDQSGIRYAVVVVSACYSGSFIDDLAAPGRIIITASAADRSSFGCASENQWTDFGRAYFDEALRQTRDFRAAFDLAREKVAEREKAAGLKPSEPQISVGAEIAAYFDAGVPAADQASN